MFIVRKWLGSLARDTETRRAELRNTLVDIAEAQIRERGVETLRAREIAEQAKCATGAIYNVFDDMTGLILAVNVRTFRRLGLALAATLEGQDARPPFERLILMSEAYVDFATENYPLWRALFNFDLTIDDGIPDWYLEELGKLHHLISVALAEAEPSATEEQIRLRTLTLISAVHGIMQFSLERRMSGVPAENLKEMIAFILQSTEPNT